MSPTCFLTVTMAIALSVRRVGNIVIWLFDDVSSCVMNSYIFRLSKVGRH